MKRLIEESETNAFHYVFNQGDVFLCDRGFRDAVEEIEMRGYEAHIPVSVGRGEDQLTTLEANKNRQVTLCQWVIEIVNGRFKRDFKLFRQDFFNRALHHMMDDFRVAASLINAFHVIVQDSRHVHEFMRVMRERLHEPNRLGAHVKEKTLTDSG
ncbi:hypothetical protein B5X24_HaOG207110 [Helicoverpa armigera]|uniref:DDE Tnp4 domain-containing protein n=1 Tax=Helicoverpa armigera TaxID=29058 RepID=A0A2W1BPP5_HELAM|nr:hypothetical protein B5X24_HaOG207110 [Helicoverpa armigera]